MRRGHSAAKEGVTHPLAIPQHGAWMDWLVVRQPPVQRRGQKEAAAALAAGVGTGQGRGMQQVPAAAAAGPQAVRLCL